METDTDLNRNKIRREIDKKIAQGTPWRLAIQQVLDPEPKSVPQDERLVA